MFVFAYLSVCRSINQNASVSTDISPLAVIYFMLRSKGLEYKYEVRYSRYIRSKFIFFPGSVDTMNQEHKVAY